MFDIHCHLLFDIDDGPRELAQSVSLCKMAETNNIEQAVLTPHLYDLFSIDSFLSKRDSRIKELRSELEQRDISIILFPGAEVLMSDDIFFVNDIDRLSINSSRYILIEFPFSGLNSGRVTKYIEELLSRKLMPVIAHAERYDFFQKNPKLINALADTGVLFQINADSLCGICGKAEFRLAKQLVKTEMASFIASDAHSINNRPNNLLEMMFNFPRDIDSDAVERMLNDNPKALIENKEVDISFRGYLF